VEDIRKAMAVQIVDSGMKKKDVAQQMEISSRKLSDLLHGRKVIDVSIIRSFCTVLDITPNDLFYYKSAK
jgi:DNA-binding Xre family transcriptional regulator